DAVGDPWESFLAGCRAFLAAGADPEIRRIVLVDAPAVLGWNEWRDMDDAASGRHLREALCGLMSAGVIASGPVTPVARLLSGAMNEAALWLAQEPDDASLDETIAALEDLLMGLRIP
ncbi:MAG TPA: TetR/AcrR family transcriptional regulator, partial [Phytomonospora sp.]